MMSAAESSTALFVPEDSKDVVGGQLASSAVWWNGIHQQRQLAAPAAGAVVDSFTYDYPVSGYDVGGVSCDDGGSGGALFYGVPPPPPPLNGNPWPPAAAPPASVQTVVDEAELYAAATAMSSSSSSSTAADCYKYPCGQSAVVDYAMLECYAAVADPVSQAAIHWTSVPYAADSVVATPYELCPGPGGGPGGGGGGAGAPMSSVSLDYCNSLQMMHYDAAFNGFAMSANQFPSDFDHVRQQATFVDKTASTPDYCMQFSARARVTSTIYYSE